MMRPTEETHPNYKMHDKENYQQFQRAFIFHKVSLQHNSSFSEDQKQTHHYVSHLKNPMIFAFYNHLVYHFK